MGLGASVPKSLDIGQPWLGTMLDRQYWVTCQLGAREHYAVARALHAQGVLSALITDSWVTPAHPFARWWPRLAQRYHPDLSAAKVFAWNGPAVAHELVSKWKGLKGWNAIMARNAWFQRRAVQVLAGGKVDVTGADAPRGVPTLFCYSYAALAPFRWAKENGWRTVLGQIDGGFGDAKLIDGLSARQQGNFSQAPMGPEIYWRHWREECRLADAIVVNSSWSKSLLLSEGIAEERLHKIPVAYTPPSRAESFRRNYPDQFTAARPLRVLSLGQVTPRKGIMEISQAARLLEHMPVEFWIVGPSIGANLPALHKQTNVRMFGPVTRAETEDLYRDADVFLFPTHSDGFGMTQLEAQAWHLPVIASTHCGEVVRPGINGHLLREISAEAIVEIIQDLFTNPGQLTGLAANTIDFSKFSLASVGREIRGVLCP